MRRPERSKLWLGGLDVMKGYRRQGGRKGVDACNIMKVT